MKKEILKLDLAKYILHSFYFHKLAQRHPEIENNVPFSNANIVFSKPSQLILSLLIYFLLRQTLCAIEV